MSIRHEGSLKEFANAVRDLLDLDPLPGECRKGEALPRRSVEQQDVERFYVAPLLAFDALDQDQKRPRVGFEPDVSFEMDGSFVALGSRFARARRSFGWMRRNGRGRRSA